MALIKCTECGTVFDGMLNACPNCGHPKDLCEEIQEETTQKENKKAPQPTQVDEDKDSFDFNEKEPYSPFKQEMWLFADPWPMKNLPRGEFARKLPILGYLLDPWFLTCRNEENREQYDTINNLFYMFNLMFKSWLYSSLWAFFKLWWLILAFIVAMYILGFVISEIDVDFITAIFVISSVIITILFALFILIECIISIGKALHRYWPSFHKTWRRMNRRYWKDMKKA